MLNVRNVILHIPAPFKLVLAIFPSMVCTAVLCNLSVYAQDGKEEVCKQYILHVPTGQKNHMVWDPAIFNGKNMLNK